MPFVSLADARDPFVLALDAGTSSVRALAFDATGNAIADSEEQIAYAIETTTGGGATFAADALFALTVKAIDCAVDRLGSRAGAVAAVGTTSFWHSLLGLDAKGEPTTPIFYWADTRSSEEALALRAELDAEAVWQRTGCRLHPSYWPAKLCWLRRADRAAFAATARWVSFSEYALARLCGDDASSATLCMASGTGLLDVHSLRWDGQMLDATGLTPDRLSPLVDLGPAGVLRDELARRWPALASAQWFPALGDGACANIGSGAVGPSRLALTVGTSAAMRLILPRPAGDAWSIPYGLWAYRLDSQRAVLGGALSNGGNLLRWIWDTTGTEPDDDATTAAVALRPDSTGLTLLPFLAGERSPGWYGDASGVFAGVTLATRPADLLRAGMEAVAYRLAAIYDALAPLATAEHEVIASGGAILSMPAWLQIIADTLGHAVLAIDRDDETTARGAALMAAVEAGIVPSLDGPGVLAVDAVRYCPNRENFTVYSAGRKRQARLEAVLVRLGEFV
jgi:gluconokinase